MEELQSLRINSFSIDLPGELSSYRRICSATDKDPDHLQSFSPIPHLRKISSPSITWIKRKAMVVTAAIEEKAAASDKFIE
jgi:hypothetical protein